MSCRLLYACSQRLTVTATFIVAEGLGGLLPLPPCRTRPRTRRASRLMYPRSQAPASPSLRACAVSRQSALARCTSCARNERCHPVHVRTLWSCTCPKVMRSFLQEYLSKARRIINTSRRRLERAAACLKHAQAPGLRVVYSCGDWGHVLHLHVF
jgi:hypothetical protein